MDFCMTLPKHAFCFSEWSNSQAWLEKCGKLQCCHCGVLLVESLTRNWLKKCIRRKQVVNHRKESDATESHPDFATDKNVVI